MTKYRFVFRHRYTPKGSRSQRPETTRIIEFYTKDEQGNELTTSEMALEFGKRLAQKRGWELLVVEQTK